MAWILFIVLAAVATVMVLASRKPDTFRVERSTLVQAAPERLYAAINDFHRWTEWSPWEGLDPAMRRTHEGSPSGVGASYAWDGNKKAGAGRMRITEADPYNRIAIALDFERPFKSSNVVEFLLQPEGDATRIRWVMNGPLPFGAKLMHVFVDMDRMIGKDFEAGLAQLKSLAEKS